ncbi:MAG TPA: NAD-dependent epimerase/dehydratase family protein [Gemmatimonadales bacterium]|nr:NAD-dependent epimerase/dehydratase family protein [Gemmatimonadales bacterium]
MRILVTGAGGFVGARLVRRLVREGHAVTGTRGGPARSHEPRLTPEEHAAVTWRTLDLADRASVERAVEGAWDAVVHLAGVSSSMEAKRDPGHAWNVNAAGTARLCHALAAGTPGAGPTVLVVSTSDVYGLGDGEPRPRRESDAPRPLSVYAASKLGAEVAAGQIARSAGLRLIVARPWPHTGAGQTDRLLPKWIAELRAGRRVLPGDPETVRDFLHVDDVIDAYLALLARGRPGETYNIASGQGVSFRDLLARLCARLGARAELAADPRRDLDAAHSVGDATKLRESTGWSPRRSLDDTLAELIDAQAD